MSPSAAHYFLFIALIFGLANCSLKLVFAPPLLLLSPNTPSGFYRIGSLVLSGFSSTSGPSSFLCIPTLDLLPADGEGFLFLSSNVTTLSSSLPVSHSIGVYWEESTSLFTLSDRTTKSIYAQQCNRVSPAFTVPASPTLPLYDVAYYPFQASSYAAKAICHYFHGGTILYPEDLLHLKYLPSDHLH